MTDVSIPPEAIRDPWEQQVSGLGLGRDPVEGVPVGGPGRGFTAGQPWLPVGTTTPADEQVQDPDSVLRLHQQLLALRRAEPALAVGSIEGVRAEDGVLAYEGRHGSRRLGIGLNLTGHPRSQPFRDGTVLLSSTVTRPSRNAGTTLSGNEGGLVALDTGERG